MSLRIPTRRLTDPATAVRSLLGRCPSCNHASPFAPLTILRGKSKTASSDKPRFANPVLEEYLRRKPKNAEVVQPKAVKGAPAEDSIFEDGEDAHFEEEADVPREKEESVVARNPEYMANVLDPEPNSRMRWERKMVIRQIRKRGRLTKAQELKRTERESMTKSPMFRTSTKKLGMLARQIAGKPIEDAIVQMRFSRKLVAQEVRSHLEYARDSAIVSRGLGLGKVEGRTGEPVQIQLKNGSRKLVEDRTSIYIDQAWVNRGTHGKSPEFRARGKMNILHHPHTSISVVLKEEATRVRLHEERQKKKLNRKLWLHLPDRPISQQRQYPLW